MISVRCRHGRRDGFGKLIVFDIIEESTGEVASGYSYVSNSTDTFTVTITHPYYRRERSNLELHSGQEQELNDAITRLATLIYYEMAL